MLTHSDIIGAKALAQLRWCSIGALIETLSQLEGRENGDLIHALRAAGHLGEAQAEKVRGMVGRFHTACHESVVLRHLERREVPNLPALLARVEAEGHRLRLVAVCVDANILTEREAWSIEQQAHQEVYRNGVALVRRYQRERFAGVIRPLIPGGAMATESFRVSRLFRDREFHVQVLQEIGRARTRILSAHTPPPLQVSDDEDTASLLEAPTTISSADGALGEVDQVGPYRLLRCLGRGGMGAVYLAVNDSDPVQAEVAIKVLGPQASKDNQGRFRREIDVSSRLSHPSLVRVLDHGALQDGTLFMVLPAYRSTSVRQLLRENLVTPTLAFELISQLLEALQAVHEAGVVHRDVKPGNILLTQETQALRLIDFGISRYLDEGEANGQFRTGEGGFVGSSQYTAPENLLTDPVDARTDLYSVGIVLFEVLTGRPPFQGMPRAQALLAHLRQVPPLLSEVAPNKSWYPELEHLVASLLAKRPADRPGSAKQVLRALQGGLASESVRLLTGGAVGQISGSFKLG